MYNPETKKLKFNSDGKFRILMISDFHGKGGVGYNPKLKKGIEALVKATEPDFVMLGGDQCISSSEEALRNALEDILEPINSRGIPWAHVYGNHDHETPVDLEVQQKIYEEFPLCLSERGPKNIKGVGNYVLPVYSGKDESIAYNIFAMNSNRETVDIMNDFGVKENERNPRLPVPFGVGRGQSMPYFSQLRWYFKTSVKMEKENGKKIPAILCMHNPCIEYNLIHKNPEETHMIGEKRECVCCSELNSGLFFACLERGDVKGIFCGHEHMNTYQGTYCGITLAYDGAVGYDMTSEDDLRGGRVIDLDENEGTFNTYHLKLMALLGDEAVRDINDFRGGLKYFIRNSHM